MYFTLDACHIQVRDKKDSKKMHTTPDDAQVNLICTDINSAYLLAFIYL